ncbi:Uncharacterized protein FWK35_00037044 [Aphis craccivora]|uniref:Uncharacterized protein n=1 Tax=Aphis craccivora TaxID=307492 RepID=A0A6G0YFC2_APHCR|nr:Uncharacterized protein FWK35_00037044 [Aphis craccivora]
MLGMNNQPTNENGNHNWVWYQSIQNLQNNIVMPEMENTNNRPMPDYLKMSNTEKLKLLTLLTDWNMGFLFKTCYDALVDIEALRHISSSQCDTLLSNYPLGIRIKFIAKLRRWKYVDSTDYDIENHNILPSFSSTFL